MGNVRVCTLEWDLNSHWSLVTLNKLYFTSSSFFVLCSCVLILLKFGRCPCLCPACCTSDAEEEQMQETTSAGSVWHRCGKLHFPPYLVLLSFTLSRRMTSLYVIKPRAHASSSVTVLASPRLCYLIGWGFHQSHAGELAPAFRWVYRQTSGSDLGLVPSAQTQTPQRVEGEIKLQN